MTRALADARARRERRAASGWTTDRAYLTDGHRRLPEVLAALGVAESAREGDATYLGRGNFGAAWRVDVGGRALVVKLPVPRNIHGRPWSREEHVGNFMHEAGVANELREAGARIVPRTTYVETSDGMPALVREHGEHARTISPAEFCEIERQLAGVEAIGWAVHDEIDLFRRPDGTLMVADVGLWQAQPPGARHESDLDHLLPLMAEKLMGARYRRVVTSPVLLRWAQRIAEAVAEGRSREPMERSHQALLARAVALRVELGLCVPSGVARLLRRLK